MTTEIIVVAVSQTRMAFQIVSFYQSGGSRSIKGYNANFGIDDFIGFFF